MVCGLTQSAWVAEASDLKEPQADGALHDYHSMRQQHATICSGVLALGNIGLHSLKKAILQQPEPRHDSQYCGRC